MGRRGSSPLTCELSQDDSGSLTIDRAARCWECPWSLDLIGSIICKDLIVQSLDTADFFDV